MRFAGMRTVVLDARAPGAGIAADEPLARRASGNEHNPGDAENADKPGNNKTESCDVARIDVVTAPELEHGAKESPDISSVCEWTTDLDQLATAVTPELIDRLRNEYEHVIIAAPPVLSTTAASTLSEVAPEVLLVLSIGETTRRDLTRATETLRATGAPPTGLVVTGKSDDSVAPDRSPVVCSH
jgi:hypothetical protein